MEEDVDGDGGEKETDVIVDHDYADGSSLKHHFRSYSTRACPARKHFPPVPTHPMQYNGIAWPDMCIEDREDSHVFIMGDYGGMTCGDHMTLGNHDPNGWACP